MDYLSSNLYLSLSNNRILRFIINRLRSIRLKLLHYKITLLPTHPVIAAASKDKYLILMVDGKIRHGGLADRLYGILCTYAYCKSCGIDFKLYFVSPFNLSLLLQPNSYDWRTFEKSDSFWGTSVLVKSGEEYTFKRFKLRKQTHLYSNAHNLAELNRLYGSSYTYSSLYNELFKPSDYFGKHLEELSRKLGQNYAAVCFRFQNLLGDFAERDYKELDPVRKEGLLAMCKKAIVKLQKTHPDILVTSDSITCLNRVASMDGVHAFPSKVVHLDFSLNEPLCVYEKSFLDFYALGRASIVYNICGHGLRRSGFPEFATRILGSKFVRIDIDEFLRGDQN